MPHYSKLNFVDIKTFRFNRLLFLYNRNIVFILSLSKRYIYKAIENEAPEFLFILKHIFDRFNAYFDATESNNKFFTC